MAQRETIRYEKQQIEAAQRMVDLDLADNKSEAIRNAVNAGFTEYGVMNGGTYDTRLRQTARRFGDALALVAIIMLGATIIAPVEFRVFVAGPLAASLGCYGLDRVLKAREPAVSNWIRGLFSRGGAA